MDLYVIACSNEYQDQSCSIIPKIQAVSKPVYRVVFGHRHIERYGCDYDNFHGIDDEIENTCYGSLVLSKFNYNGIDGVLIEVYRSCGYKEYDDSEDEKYSPTTEWIKEEIVITPAPIPGTSPLKVDMKTLLVWYEQLIGIFLEIEEEGLHTKDEEYDVEICISRTVLDENVKERLINSIDALQRLLNDFNYMYLTVI